MEIILGKRSGFCYGVQNAVEKANKQLTCSSEKIYCLGELVHNKSVTEELKDKGLIFINDIKEAKGKTIIRAHGISKQIYEAAKKLNIDFVDLTCPNVIKIHEMAEEYSNKGYYILLIGKKDHPETIGTISFCGKYSNIISEEDEVKQVIEEIEKTNLNKILVISQTTYSIEKFNNIVDKLIDSTSRQIEVKNTICLATELRQKETEEIAKQVEFMIVVGGKNSSNTTKLYEICMKNCENVIHIENEEEIDLNQVLKFNKIGIVAGASTPKSSICKVINLLKNKEENL